MSGDNKAKEIFLEAIELVDERQRTPFVERACGDDAELHLRVMRLIEAHIEADSLLDNPKLALKEDANPGALPETLPSQAVKAGVQIGPYKLLEQIGAGGMGVVYMAEQLKPIRRKVAVKIIKPGMDTAQVIARFEAERQALAMMDHPNIARVLDAGTTDFQRPYFVMELVRGIPITDYCDKNKLTTSERLELFATVCKAVQHAHTKGIIHRDLKPSNILVTLHDGVPVPKIIDFGVAKATSQQLTDRTLFTSIHQFVGTPLYMSPEQAELSGLDVDTRSDIYSLGVLLYELLTGTTPFDRRRLNEAALDEVRRIIREEEPQKPSTRVSSMGNASTSISASRSTDAGKLAQSLRHELDWIIMKTLEKDRTRRYETANALANEIQRYLNGEPVEACPPSTAYRMRKFVRRHRTPVGFASAIGLLILGSTLVAWWLYADASRSRDKAVAAQMELASQRDRALDAEKSAAANLATANREKARADEKSIELSQRLYNYNILKAESAFLENQFDKAQSLLADCDESQRGWEWRFLHRRTGGRRTIRIPAEVPVEFALTSDGKRIVIVDNKGLVSLMQIQDESLLWTQKTEISLSWGLAFAPDENSVLVVGNDEVQKAGKDVTGTVQLLDMKEGRSLWSHAIPQGNLTFPKFSPDGSHILFGLTIPSDKRWEVQVLLAKDGSLVSSIPTKRAAQAIFDQTGERVLITEADDVRPDIRSTIRCLSVKDSSPVWSIERPANTSCITLSPDGTEIVGGGFKHSLVVWDAETGTSKGEFEGPNNDPAFMSRFCQDGSRLLTLGTSADCVVWDWKSKKPIQALGKISRDAFVVHLTPDGMHLVYADSTPDRLLSRSITPPALTLELIGHRQGFKGAAFLDRETVVSAGPEGAIRIWNATTGQELRTIPTGATCLNVAASHDGKTIATVSTKGVAMWDRSSVKPIHQWNEMGETWFAQFVDNGRILAAAGKSGTLKLWSTEDGRELHSLQLSKSIFGFAVSEDGTWAIAMTEPGCELTFWNIIDNKSTIIRQSMDVDRVRSVGTIRGGKWVAIGVGTAVEIWDVKSKQLVTKLAGPHGRVMSLVGNTGGNRLFVGTADGVIQVWNLDSKELISHFDAHDNMIVSLALSHDQATLLSSSHGGELKLWESGVISPNATERRTLVQKATELVNRNLVNKTPIKDLVAKLATDTTIQDSELRSLALEIANARMASPIVLQAYGASTSGKGRKQVRSIQESMDEAAEAMLEQFESAIADKLTAIVDADDKKYPAGSWHSLANAITNAPQFSISSETLGLLLGRLTSRPYPPHHLCYLEGVFHAQNLQWDRAEQAFSKALERVPEKSKYWHEYAYRLAFLRAYLGKWDAYHALCAKTMGDFGDTVDEKLAERTSKMCLFSDQISVDLDKAGHLADWPVKETKDSDLKPYIEQAAGIANLRRGMNQQAISYFLSSIDGLTRSNWISWNVSVTTNKLYLAIAYVKADRMDDAKKIFEEATRELNELTESPHMPGWNDWMNAKIVHAEAKALLEPEKH